MFTLKPRVVLPKSSQRFFACAKNPSRVFFDITNGGLKGASYTYKTTGFHRITIGSLFFKNIVSRSFHQSQSQDHSSNNKEGSNNNNQNKTNYSETITNNIKRPPQPKQTESTELKSVGAKQGFLVLLGIPLYVIILIYCRSYPGFNGFLQYRTIFETVFTWRR